ncbi:MAG: hypothetical protein NT155_01700 [Candidatus Staskawiczbacteria bacterium]|nr:hypothetical protein [Candidatus Staskawiczbacteria bacterium]
MLKEPGEHFEEEPQPEEQKPERTSGLMRVVGVSRGQEKTILKNVKTELFDKQAPYGIEREKSPEELEIISQISSCIPEFIEKYGGDPAPIKPEHVHIIDFDKVDLSELTEEQREKIDNAKNKVGGRYRPYKQAVSIFILPEMESRLYFAQRVAHELIHFNAFQSANYGSKDGKISSRVEGFVSTTKAEEDYFKGINEAVTEELTKRFDKEYFGSISVLADDIRERDSFSATVRVNPGVVASLFVTKEKSTAGRPYAYREERKKLKGMMKDIQLKNPEQFQTREDVFNVFAEAYFTGKRLRVARLVEKTYGKGAFRKLGEETRAIKIEDKK